MHALGTPAFLASLRQNHAAPVRVVARGPLGDRVLDRVVAGSVEVDRNAAVRRRVQVTVADEAGLLVPQGPERNVALGQVVSAHSGPVADSSGALGQVTVVTDGVIDAGTGATLYRATDGPERWVQIDLGRVVRIGSVRVWHFYGDSRQYAAPRTEVSLDGVTWQVVARPQPYTETSAGNLRTFDPVRARYVRDYTSGNSVNAGNHWQEVQVFTAPDVLSAYGGDLLVQRGVRTPDGATVLVPLGTFRITDVDVEDTGSGVQITVTGFDRAHQVQRARLVNPYVVAAGTNVATAIRALLDSRVTGLSYAITPTSRVTPGLVFDTGADPWEQAQKMAEGIGYELFFDADGVCVGRPEPDPVTARSVDTYTDGVDSHTLSVAKGTATDQTYSRVVVTGEAADDAAPVRAEATDATLQALLGDVPFFLTSAFLTVQAQAQDVADALIRRVQTLTENVKVSAVVNPALAEGDVVTVRRGSVEVDAAYVVDAFSVPLQGGLHTLTMRKRRTT